MIWMKSNKPKVSLRAKSGLTLVEVLIALAIFVTSYFVFIDSQNINIRQSAVSRRMTQATILAQEKLSEMVLKYQEKNLSEIPSKEEGTFDAPYSHYRWEKTSRDFRYDLSFLAEMGKTGKKEKEESPLMTYLPKISDFIKNASKEITVTVYWKEGSGERKVQITTHLVDINAKLPL